MITISTVNYRETIFDHPDLTKIRGVPTYDNLHLLHNNIEPNAIAVSSNFGGGQHGYRGLLVSPSAYALLSDTPFVCPIHPVNLSIPIVKTHHAQEEIKHQYKKIYKYFKKRED